MTDLIDFFDRFSPGVPVNDKAKVHPRFSNGRLIEISPGCDLEGSEKTKAV